MAVVATDMELYIIDISDHTILALRDELKYIILAMTHHNDSLVITGFLVHCW